MSGPLPWYVARASGLVGWGLLTAATLWGLALSTKVFGKRPRPNWLLDLHRMLGALALVFTGVHVGAIMLDQYVNFGLTQVLVPFAAKWHPVAVAWGIVGFYMLAAVEITSLLRSRIPKRFWRQVHYLSFPLFVFATVHGLSAGSDTTRRVGVLVAVAAGASFLAMVAIRAAVSSVEPPTRVNRPIAGGASGPLKVKVAPHGASAR
jgi:DMSO/TMAO reductase YedYZ heme-binding membrane subunit